MTTQDYTDRAGSDFADTDVRFAGLLAGLDWLDDEGTHLARLGLRELRRNIRTYTLDGRPGDIDITATATPSGLTVIVEDAGPEVRGVLRAGRPDPAGSGDHRLRVLDRAYDQVTYARALGRNRWILRRFARPAAAAARLSDAA